MKMLFKKLLFILFLSVNSIGFCLGSNLEENNKSNLYLYLVNINNFLKNFELETGQKLDLDIKYLNRTIELFSKISQDFKNGVLSYNPEISYNFFDIIYNSLPEPKEIKYKDLRSLKDKITFFSDYLKTYKCRRKSFLNDQDKNFLENLIEFFDLLTELFLQDRFLDLGLWEDLKDIIYYIPLEFLDKNKSTIAPIIATTGICSLVFIFYKIFKDKNKKGLLDDDSDDLDEQAFKMGEIINSFRKVNNKVTRQQSGQCGQNSLKNIILFLIGAKDKVNDPIVSAEILKIINKHVEQIRKVNKTFDKRKLTYLRSDELEKIIPVVLKNLKQQNIAGIDFKTLDIDDILVIQPDEVKKGFDYFIYFSGYSKNLLQAIESFKKVPGKKQGIIIGYGNFHWFGAGLSSGENKQVDLFDSVGLSQQNNKNLNIVLSAYERDILPSIDMLEIEDSLATIRGILESNMLLDSEKNLPKGINLWQRFCKVLDLAIKKDFLTKIEFFPYKEELEKYYKIIRNILIKEKLIEKIKNYNIILKESENLDDYVQKLKEQE